MSPCDGLKTDLERRWNVEATSAGFAGSEYIDDPERVFERVKDMKRSLHEARMAETRLKQRIRDILDRVLDA